MERKPSDIKTELTDNQFKLYDLIWKRTLASQMSPSISLETTYYIKSENFLLKASGSIEKFSGFKKVYNFYEKDNEAQTLLNLNQMQYLIKII